MAPKRQLILVAGDEGAPPGKRTRAAAPGGQPPSPGAGWRLLRYCVLVVLFMKRTQESKVPCSISQIRRVVREEVQRGVDKVWSLMARLESLEKKIQNMAHKVEGTPSQPNHHNHQRLMQAANQERVNNEGLVRNEGEGKSTNVRLRFINGMKPSIYHEEDIKADADAAIKIGIFDGEQMIKSGLLSKARLEILALEGDFPYDSLDSWDDNEFNKHIARGRDGKSNVLVGECTVKLFNGEASLGSIRFREGSCRARRGKFILGARVCGDVGTGGRVQGAVTTPVVVQDRRNKANEKSHPPKLDDKVHRLEEIAIGGAYFKRLEKKRICTVQDFLRALNKDPDNLAEILLMNKEHKPWEKLVSHAKKCCLKGKNDLKSYPGTEGNVVLFFNCVHYLVGATFDSCYTASDKFNSDQQDLVDKLKDHAYNQLDDLQPDHVMKDGSPVRISTGSNAGAGTPFLMPTASQPNHPNRHEAHQDALVAVADQGLNHAQVEPSYENTNNCASFSIPGLHNMHNYQDEGIQFPLASIAGYHQNVFGQLNSSIAATKERYSGADDGEMKTFLDQLVLDQNCLDAPGFVPMYELCPHNNNILGASTSAHGNTTSTLQQLPFHGPAQMGMQRQMQAPLPGDGPSEASTSSQNQSYVTPQQWSQCHDRSFW